MITLKKSIASILILALLTMLVSGCKKQSVKPVDARLPLKPLSEMSKQPPLAVECSPTCLTNLTISRESMRERLINQE